LPVWGLIAGGLGIWLFLMLVFLPLTGGGVFGSEIVGPAGMWTTILGYLVVSLAYTAMLILAQASIATYPNPTPSETMAGRRAIVIGFGSLLAAVVSTYLLQLGRSARRSSQAAPVAATQPGVSPTPVGPGSHPDLVNAPPGDQQPAVAGVQATSVSSPPRFPEPRPARGLKRDKDGAVLPSGRRKGDLTDLITSNDDFYIVTKNAAGDPILHAQDWRLRVDGAVARSINLDYVSLRNLPPVDITKTLECISNFAAHCELAPYGCDLISTAHWRGARLSDVLNLAGGVKPNAKYLLAISADEYTTALPIDVALAPDVLVVYEMNGEVLPREHGYPARLLVPGRYGMKSPKWLAALRLQAGEVTDWYGQRNWSKTAIVKTMSRIDVPLDGTLPPGEYNIAGIAYAGDRGVARVQFTTDGGDTWAPADLIEPPAGRDTWVRWIGRFLLATGDQPTLRSRAIDGTGEPQVEEFSLPQPDGSSGWPSVEVRSPGS
jgi:DMSO/TMAO reductase YedYZ molybdopterin-dependent catalytic subunit